MRREETLPGGLETGFLLDRQWHWMRTGMEQSKKPALLAVGRVLFETRTPYALIGGLALQVHQEEPRTTVDIDLAVLDREAIPQEALEAVGFSRTGQFEHSENWRGPEPEGTPVQFTDDPALAAAVGRAEEIELDGVPLRVIIPSDLLHEKLRAAADPARRRSKRLQDFADAQGLLEAFPDLAAGLTAEERAALARLPV
jgi:hypothetical protein